MSEITSLRFILVKTSAIGVLAEVGGDLETAGGFIILVRVHPVVKAGPLRVARVEFLVGDIACVRAPPCLGGKAPQGARPAALRIRVAVGMRAGERVRDGAPCAEKVGLRELIELRTEGAASDRTWIFLLTANAARLETGYPERVFAPN